MGKGYTPGRVRYRREIHTGEGYTRGGKNIHWRGGKGIHTGKGFTWERDTGR